MLNLPVKLVGDLLPLLGKQLLQVLRTCTELYCEPAGQGGGKEQRGPVPMAGQQKCWLAMLCGQATMVREDRRRKSLRSVALYHLWANTLALSEGFCSQSQMGNMLYFFFPSRWWQSCYLLVESWRNHLLVCRSERLQRFSSKLIVQAQFEGSFVCYTKS